MTYKEETKKAMNLLAEDPRTIFIGQGVLYPGHGMFASLEDIPDNRKIELPVIEDTQLGLCIGMSLSGFVPVSIFPRMDFLILAMNQLINHLDKIEEMSCGQFKPKVIIRTAVGSKIPLNPGPQHSQDHTEMLKACLININVVKLERVEDIIPAYRKALESLRSTILIEVVDKLK